MLKLARKRPRNRTLWTTSNAIIKRSVAQNDAAPNNATPPTPFQQSAGRYSSLVQEKHHVETAPVVRHPGEQGAPWEWDWWLLVGGCVGCAFLLAVVLALWMATRSRKKRRFAEAHGFLGPAAMTSRRSSDARAKMSSIGSYLSSGSDTSDIQAPISRAWSRSPALSQSASLDLTTGQENGNSRPSLARWNSLTSTVYPTTVIGTVQPDLYRTSSDEEDTCSPPACSNGRLWFSLQYSPQEDQLTVHLIKAKYLPGRGVNGGPRDPFVRLLLLPDEENYQQSKVRKRTLAPKFNEVFTFRLDSSELSERTLRLSVYDVDKKKVRQCLGHVLIPLSRVDLFTSDVIWRDLENTWQHASNLGDMEVCMSCNPFTNKIKATVCRLKYVAACPTPDTGVFVKVQLYHGEKALKTKCTHVRRSRSREDDVPFEETFAFGVSGRYLDACSIVFTACTVEGNKEQPYGRLVLGPFLYARGDQLAHWQEMMANPRHPITKWHPLETPPTCG